MANRFCLSYQIWLPRHAWISRLRKIWRPHPAQQSGLVHTITNYWYLVWAWVEAGGWDIIDTAQLCVSQQDYYWHFSGSIFVFPCPVNGRALVHWMLVVPLQSWWWANIKSPHTLGASYESSIALFENHCLTKSDLTWIELSEGWARAPKIL